MLCMISKPAQLEPKTNAKAFLSISNRTSKRWTLGKTFQPDEEYHAIIIMDLLGPWLYTVKLPLG